MRPYKNNLRFMGKLWMILSAPFLAASMVFVVLRMTGASETPDDLIVFVILSSVFGFIGVLWLAMGVCFYMYAKRKDDKRDRLKREGRRYGAEIVRIVPNPYIHINGHIAVRAECSYINHEGKICLVKSDLFLQYLPNDNLNASVYVSRKDPRDYFVEINSNEETNIQFDYDYR